MWKDGRLYVGLFKRDKKHGYGVFYWPDGRKYKGGWLDNKQHGFGTQIPASGKGGRFGVWNAGKRLRWLDDDEKQEFENGDLSELLKSPEFSCLGDEAYCKDYPPEDFVKELKAAGVEAKYIDKINQIENEDSSED